MEKARPRLFTITSPNHHQVLANALWQSFATSYLTDFTFQGGGINVNAHKLILEAFVPPEKLRQTAANRQFVDQEEELANMHAVLEFVYTGSVSVTKERLDHVQQIAGDLDFQLLIDAVGSASEQPFSAAVVACVEPGNAESGSASIVGGKAPGEPDHPSAEAAANNESQLAVGPIIELLIRTEGDPPEQWERRQVGESEAVAIFLEAGHQLLEEVVEDVGEAVDPFYQPVEEEMEEAVATEADELKTRRVRPRSVRRKTRDPKPPRSFVCPTCGKRFGTSFTLGRHVLTHTQARPFKCQYCSYACNAQDNLNKHVATRHPEGGRQFACRTCGRRYTTAFELARHFRTHTKEKPLRCTFDSTCTYTCNFANNLQRHLEVVHCVGDSQFACQHCGKRCMCRSELERHLRTHVADKAHRCPHCSYSTDIQASLQRHLASKHEEGEMGEFECEKCERRFSTRAAVTRHAARTHTEAKAFKCTECNFASNAQVNVTRHAAVAHGVGQAPFACEECGKRCGSRVDLDRHCLTHGPDRPLKCPHCPHAANDMRNHKRHMLAKHTSLSGESGRLFTCLTCCRNFDSSAGLDRHMHLSHGVASLDKPFKCLMCRFAAKTKENLRRHLVVVHAMGDNQFTCEECGKRCGCRAELARHALIHGKVKPFQCPHCPHAANDVQNLKRHVDAIHGRRDLPFPCRTCDRGFATQAALDRHENREHSGDKPYNCEHCSFASKVRETLRRHVTVVHAVGEDPFTCEKCGKRCGCASELDRHMLRHGNRKPFRCPYCPHAANDVQNLKRHIAAKHGQEGALPHLTRRKRKRQAVAARKAVSLQDGHSQTDLEDIEEVGDFGDQPEVMHISNSDLEVVELVCIEEGQMAEILS